MSSNVRHIRLETMTDNNAVQQVLPILFRKIVRLLIGTVSFPVVAELLKSIYVEEATRKLKKSDTKPTKTTPHRKKLKNSQTRLTIAVKRRSPHRVPPTTHNRRLDLATGDWEPATLPVDASVRSRAAALNPQPGSG